MATLHPIEAFTVPSEAVSRSGWRLEGSFYGSDGYRAARLLFRSGFDLPEVRTRAKVLWFGPFARTYVVDPSKGIPFISSAEMMEARIRPEKFLSATLTRVVDRLRVQEGIILISCSGTIGNVALCTSDLDGMAVSQHAIRVIPNDKSDLGLFYTLFQSSAGKFLIKRSRSGSVIESIYEDDVSGLFVPVLPRSLRERLTEMIEEVCRLHVEANELLDEAEAQVQRQCGLPDLSELDMTASEEVLSKALIFRVPATEVFGQECKYGSVRLDATYHLPLASKLRHLIMNSGGKELETIVTGVRRSALRQRTYVDGAVQGIPLIGGKQMMQVRPSDISYISKAMTRGIERERVYRGWTLVTCSGTLGRVQFVHRNFEDFIPSEHCMRIIPNEIEAKAGFIYAFLASPYGQVQLAQLSYGSVIPELRDFQFNSIAVALPSDHGKSIHKVVVRAFDCRADALALEDDAIRLFETAVEEGKETTEENWGREY